MTILCGKGTESSNEIGGYFDLDLPDHGDPFPDAYKFQSGRAALRAVIECAGIKRIMLPAYICDSVIQAVSDSGAIVETYLLDDLLYPGALPSTLPDKCALLYVNYFGLCQKNVDQLLQYIPSKRLIVDNSQALFALPTDALANIYSPRKFVGLPDGGLVVSNQVKIKCPEEDSASTSRMRHLFLRMAYTAQDGYQDYVESEKGLSNTTPLRMSRLTKRLLASIDMAKAKRQRRENFLVLANRLDKYNIHKLELDSVAVPMCYPLIVDWDVDHLKKRLVGKGIYIPTYWPDAKPRVLFNSIEHRLTNCCLAIPCDQRYTHRQMHYLADTIISGFDER